MMSIPQASSGTAIAGDAMTIRDAISSVLWSLNSSSSSVETEVGLFGGFEQYARTAQGYGVQTALGRVTRISRGPMGWSPR